MTNQMNETGVSSVNDFPEHIVFTKRRFKEHCEAHGVEPLEAIYPQWVEERVAETKEPKSSENLVIDSNQGKDDLVTLKDINLFAAHLVAWHQRQLALVDQVMEVPEGQEIEVTDRRTNVVEVIKLEGENLKAFLAGVSVVMSFFGNLPFQAIPVEASNEKPEQPEG